MKKRIISILLILPVLFGVPAYAVEESGEEITVYMTVEKFTLGQGFILEPITVQTVQGASCADVLELIMSGRYNCTGTVEDNIYVTAFEDSETDVNIPDYIAEAVGDISTRQDSEWLTEFDYTNSSGWKYSVNNEFSNVSASDMYLHDGDVMRWQYTLYGYGSDLGMNDEAFGMESLGVLADKTDLIRYVADIKNEYVDLSSNWAYNSAMEVLTRIDSTQEEVNEAYDLLSGTDFLETDIEYGYGGGNLNLTADYIKSMVTEPQIASIGGEWAVLGLARSGIDIDKAYFDGYYDRVVDYVRKSQGVIHKRKYSEYSRVIMALTSIGMDPGNVGGYNLLTPLTDFDATMKQGLNGAIFALLALDCDEYDVYGGDSVREKYVDEILSRQHDNGAFSLSENSDADIDITAMALSALSNYTEDVRVKSAVDRALQYISEIQESDGGFSVYGEKNSESAVQVLVALTSLGISPDDERFVKNGNSVLDHLLTYARDNGGFAHIVDGDVDLMATEQALYALAAVERFNEKKSSLYDMTDVNRKEIVGPARAVEGYGISQKKILDLAECLW